MAISWPFNYPSIIKPFAQSSKIAYVIRENQHVANETLLEIAVDLHLTYGRGKTFQQSLQVFLDLCRTISSIEVNTVGAKATRKVSPTIMVLMAKEFVNVLDLSIEDIKYLYRLEEEVDKDTQCAWFAYVISHFLYIAAQKFKTIDYAKRLGRLGPFGWKLPWLDKLYYSLVEKVSPDVKVLIPEIMGAITKFRKYGVKPCFFQDGIMHAPGEAWTFQDINDIRSVSTSVRVTKGVAIVGLSKRSSIADLQITKDDNGVLDLGVGPAIFWTIDENGELTTGLGHAGVSVREIFRQAGKEGLYEVLRFSHVLRLYDLVMPIEVVQQMPQFTTRSSAVQRLIKELDQDPELVLRRIKVLDNQDVIIEKLEKEIEEADKETFRRTRSELQRHIVVAHIRRLPDGYRPSTTSRKLAKKELGVDLAENETYVHKHIRGKIGVIKPPLAKQCR